MDNSDSQGTEQKSAKIIRCPRCGMRLNEDGLAILKSAKPSEQAIRSAAIMIYEGGWCEHDFVE